MDYTWGYMGRSMDNPSEQATIQPPIELHVKNTQAEFFQSLSVFWRNVVLNKFKHSTM